MREDEEAIIYWRGRFELDFKPEEHVDLDEEGDPELDDLDEDELLELAVLFGCSGFTDETEEDELRGVITRRVKNELEPIIHVKHYCKRNEGKNGKTPWLICGDPVSAVNATDWKFDTDCVFCYERMQGDKGLSTQTLYVWSIFDTRADHKLPAASGGGGRDRRNSRGYRGGGKDKDEKKNQYAPCTMRTKKRCSHCSTNKRIDPRPQNDIPLEELKKLVESENYARCYTGKTKYIELPESDYSKVEDLEQQARAMCRSCSDGDLTVSGATCPECDDDFDFDELLSEGWDPDDPENVFQVRCECGARVRPQPAYECSEDCGDPTPARLSDVPCRVKMTLEGGNNRRVYHFSLAGRPEVHDYGDDEEWDEMRKYKLPDYDQLFAPPEVNWQLSQLDLDVNPITGEEKDDSVPDAPTVGRASRLASKGSKGGKSPSKGGKSKGKVKRGSGFLRRG